jgi:hypothetical protein
MNDNKEFLMLIEAWLTLQKIYSCSFGEWNSVKKRIEKRLFELSEQK